MKKMQQKTLKAFFTNKILIAGLRHLPTAALRGGGRSGRCLDRTGQSHNPRELHHPPLPFKHMGLQRTLRRAGIQYLHSRLRECRRL